MWEIYAYQHRGAQENALDDVSFSARRGDTIAFVGPSGSGKSTLVKLLLGLYRPASGEVFFNEVSTRKLRYNEARRQVGYVTQETSLFGGTASGLLQGLEPLLVQVLISDLAVKAVDLAVLHRPTPLCGALGQRVAAGDGCAVEQAGDVTAPRCPNQ
jgi:ATP-binding cassette subfamily B protein